MVELKMEEQTRLLLQRAEALCNRTNKDVTIPRHDTLVALIAALADQLRYEEERIEAIESQQKIIDKQGKIAKKNGYILKQRELLLEQPENVRKPPQKLVNRKERLAEEKLQAMEKELAHTEAALRRYRDLFELAPDAYLITGIDGSIIDVNQAATAMLNRPKSQLIGSLLTSFVAEPDRRLFVTLLENAPQVQDIELCIKPYRKDTVNTAITMSTEYGDEDNPYRFRWLLRDVTDRRRVMQAINASERRFRALFDEATIGIVLLDMDGCISRTNRAFQEMLGFAEHELYNRSLLALTCTEDRSFTETALQSIQEGLQPQARFQKRYQGKDGQPVWVQVSISALRDDEGNLQYILELAENITAEKQAEVEMAEMRTRLLESGEVERMRLAQELHDGPIQDLYGAVFRLADFLAQEQDPTMQENLKEVQTIVKGVASTLRGVLNELRPPTIGNLGLEPAIRSHAERVQERCPGLHIQLNLSKDGQMLPAPIRLALFRVYQQCLLNVVRHAQATRVIVAFHVSEEEVTLDVWDNGKGFDLPDKWVDLLRQGHYGLASIAERVEALNGTLKIETHPGGGTLIHVTAPRAA